MNFQIFLKFQIPEDGDSLILRNTSQKYVCNVHNRENLNYILNITVVYSSETLVTI
jgi:hypothetical protein